MMKLFAAILITVTVGGCSSTSLLKAPAAGLSAPISSMLGRKKTSEVAKVLCLWEAAEGQGLDEKPSRGFAGQIMFFGYGEASPVQAHGTVRIFEYTDFDADEEDPQAVHEFVFDDGGWNAHRVDGTVGTTYNVFLPYVEKNSGHVVCALRVEFESHDGRKVSSPFTEVTLASRTSHRPPTAMQRHVISKEKSGVRQASGIRQEKLWKDDVRDKLESTTIQFPSSSR